MWGILWARGISQLMWSGDVFILIFFCRSLNTQKTQNAERHSFKHSLTHASVNTSTVFQESALIFLRVKEEPSCSMEEKERMIGGKGGQCPNKTPQMPPPTPFFLVTLSQATHPPPHSMSSIRLRISPLFPEQTAFFNTKQRWTKWPTVRVNGGVCPFPLSGEIFHIPDRCDGCQCVWGLV